MIGSEKLCEEIFLRPCSKDLLVLMQLSQIAKTVQLFGLKKGWKNDMPVLGLAGRHSEK